MPVFQCFNNAQSVPSASLSVDSLMFVAPPITGWLLQLQASCLQSRLEKERRDDLPLLFLLS